MSFEDYLQRVYFASPRDFTLEELRDYTYDASTAWPENIAFLSASEDCKPTEGWAHQQRGAGNYRTSDPQIRIAGGRRFYGDLPLRSSSENRTTRSGNWL